MSILTPTRVRPHSDDDVPPALRPPTGRRSRRAPMAVFSVVVIGASVAAFADLYSSAGHRTAAVVVEQALVQGQPITEAQLGQADVSVSSGVSYIPVTDASVILGKRAAAAVPAGSLLTPGDLTSAPAVPAGDAVVGVALKEGQFPTSGLETGGQVMVVQTATPGAPLAAPVSGSPTSATATGSGTTVFSGSGTGVLVARATVFSASAPPANGSGGFAEVVSLEVPSSVAPSVATASSAGQVSLVLLGRPRSASTTGTSAMPGGASS